MHLPCLFLACLVALASAQEPAGHHRQGRQGTVTLSHTKTVAVTEVAFETVPSVCVSLVGASVPCVGRRAVRSPEFKVEPTSVRREIIKSAEPDFHPEVRSIDDGDLIEGSIVGFEGRQSNQSTNAVANFFQSLSHGFSAAFGITRTVVTSVTETKTVTTTYTETSGFKSFEIHDCVPPVLHYPICPNRELSRE